MDDPPDAVPVTPNAQMSCSQRRSSQACREIDSDKTETENQTEKLREMVEVCRRTYTPMSHFLVLCGLRYLRDAAENRCARASPPVLCESRPDIVPRCNA